MKEVKFWGMMAMMLCAMVMGSSSCSDDEDGLPVAQLPIC